MHKEYIEAGEEKDYTMDVRNANDERCLCENTNTGIQRFPWGQQTNVRYN